MRSELAPHWRRVESMNTLLVLLTMDNSDVLPSCREDEDNDDDK